MIPIVNLQARRHCQQGQHACARRFRQAHLIEVARVSQRNSRSNSPDLHRIEMPPAKSRAMLRNVAKRSVRGLLIRVGELCDIKLVC